MTTTTTTPKFRKVGPATFEVSILGVVAGTVTRYGLDASWSTFYNDGTPGHSAARRIDAAWLLINS